MAQYLFNGLRIVVNNTFEQKVIFDLRSDLYWHMQQLPLRWFDNRATGDLMTRVLEDVTAVERMLIDGLEQGVVAILQVVVVAVVLFRLDPTLALLALSPLPFLAAGALTYTLTAHTRYRVQRTASSTMNALLHDNLAGIRQIKTFVREREEHGRFNTASRQLGQATLVVMKAWGYLLGHGLPGGGRAGPGGRLRRKRRAARATGHRALRAISPPRPVYVRPDRLAASLNQLFQAGRAAGERVFEIMDEEPEPHEPGRSTRQPAGSGRGRVPRCLLCLR